MLKKMMSDNSRDVSKRVIIEVNSNADVMAIP